MYQILVITVVVAGPQGGAYSSEHTLKFDRHEQAEIAYDAIVNGKGDLNRYTDMTVIKLYK